MRLEADSMVILKRGMRRGMTTLLREREWSTTLGTLIGVFLLVQLLVVLLITARGMQSLLRSRTDLRLEVQANATDQEIGQFFSVLQQQSFVEEAAYITKEQAYERASQYDAELIAFLEQFGMGNPFPDTIGVTLSSLDDYTIFRSFIEQEQWHSVVDPTFLSEVTDQETQVYELLQFTHAGRSITTVILLLVGGVLVFLTIELVRRRVLARANEVVVEKLVGASPVAMFIPFATEALLLLLVATIISMFGSTVFLLTLPALVPALQTGGVLAALSAETGPLLQNSLPVYFLIELLLVIGIATGGTWLGMHRELVARSLSPHTA